MTSLVQRPPYSQEELKQLYPANLELKLVQVLLRHGERVPVSTRFQNVARIMPLSLNIANLLIRLDWRRTGRIVMLLNGFVPSP